MITEAGEGRLTVSFGDSSSNRVRVDAEEFVAIERECEAFKTLIAELQRVAIDISEREVWGLGEAINELVSARTLVSRFREKGKGSTNSVHAILDEHYKIVDDLQILHRAIAQKYMQTDAEFSAQYSELMAAAPQPGMPGAGSTPEQRV
ncbi:hypothetical protein [Nocardia camponoti]|uniref:hypothetical protein n=1 Tax=Nocardia camponoti TaxID=1616106 RepID=UPI001E4ED84A|nr:hypothetical protein [Nocardia camponoti]